MDYTLLQLSSLENPFPRNSDWKVGILQSIRPHCPKEKQKILDMMLNLFQMQNMIEKTQLFQKTFTPPETINPILNENNPSLLSEQNQDMFFKLLEMFSSLSSPMNASKQNSYTNNENNSGRCLCQTPWNTKKVFQRMIQRSILLKNDCGHGRKIIEQKFQYLMRIEWK